MNRFSLRLRMYLACSLFYSHISMLPVSAQTKFAENYAWHFPIPDTIRLANDLVELLREETDKILQAGPLAPIRLAYSDLYFEHYFQYQEPGRILTTLAWAWPYMTSDQQAATLDYVTNELVQPDRSPWAVNFTLPRDQGARRELFPSRHKYGVESTFGDFRPRLHTLYGFWLFCYRSGQSALMQTYYEDLKNFYNGMQARAKLYGDMNGHLAMARLAHVNGDVQQVTFALQRLEEELEDGLIVDHKHDFARSGLVGWDAPYNRVPGSDMYDSRKDGLLYRGFIFLNMGPEIARFLKDHCLAQVDSMHREGIRLLPMWWLMQAPYFPRWTGDESIGVPTEAFGMYHPVETWVLETPAQGLRRFMRSSPTGIGDCYWLEALVQTIEAHAVHTTWTDVRQANFPRVVVEEEISGVKPMHPSPLQLVLSPNPASEQIGIHFTNDRSSFRWSIRDMKGGLMAKGFSDDPGMLSISVKGWHAGSYICVIESLDGLLITSQIFMIQ